MDTKKLIEKYYKGETSLDEENRLRDTIDSKDAKCSDQYCRLMFDAFSKEKDEVVPSSVKSFTILNHKYQKIVFYRKRWIYIASGIAACFIVVFSMFLYLFKQENNAYVIINSVRINDEKLAIQYINNSFKKEDSIINVALTQLDEIEKIGSLLNSMENMLNDSIKYIIQKI